MIQTNVAVIGAGMAGLTLANTLSDQGVSVTLFEKARGSGGRLSSKAITLDDKGERITFDLGATHFAVQDPAFRDFLAPLVSANKAAHWPDENNYIGLSRNSALTRALADKVTVQFSTRVVKISRTAAGLWQLWQEAPKNESSETTGTILLAEAEHVVLAIPPEQARDLLASCEDEVAAGLHEQLSAMVNAYIAPQWVIGLVLANDEATQRQAKQSEQALWHPVSDVIDQVSLESAKPQRADHTVLQVQATAAWTQARLDWSKEEVAAELLIALKTRLPEWESAAGDYQALHVHRWLYSYPQPQESQAYSARSYLSSKSGLHLCGDYFLAKGKRDGVESAFKSGQQLAQYITPLLV